MPSVRKLHILRGEMELGVLSDEDARALLQLGFLKPDDYFWSEGMTECKPLSKLQLCSSKESWLEKAKKSARQAGQKIVGTANNIAATFKNLSTETKIGASQIAEKALEGYLPQIERAVTEAAKSKPFLAMKAGLQDEVFMKKLFGATYDCLPKPVQRFVCEERFVTFCMKHKHRLLGL